MPSNDSATEPKRRRWPKRVLLTFASIAALLVVAECSMIVFEPHLPGSSQFVYDAELGFRVRPNLHDGVNALGFLDADRPLAKPEGVVRVLCIGDSFNWVAPLSYVDELRRIVDQYNEGPVEVLNMGYPRTHTGHQRQILERWGVQYQPDLVILTFFAGDDFVEADPQQKLVALNDCFFAVDPREGSSLFGYPMVGASRVWAYATQRLFSSGEDAYATARARRRAAKSASNPKGLAGFSGGDLANALRFLAGYCEPESRLPSYSATAYAERVADKMEFCDVRPAAQDRFRAHVRFALGEIDAIAALLRDRGIDFLVGILPDEFQVVAEVRDTAIRQRQRTAADYNLTRAQDLLKAHLAERQIAHLDFREVLSAANAIRSVYTPRDSHLGNFGSSVVAHAYYVQFLADYLDRRGRRKKLR